MYHEEIKFPLSDCPFYIHIVKSYTVYTGLGNNKCIIPDLEQFINFYTAVLCLS